MPPASEQIPSAFLTPQERSDEEAHGSPAESEVFYGNQKRYSTVHFLFPIYQQRKLLHSENTKKGIVIGNYFYYNVLYTNTNVHQK
ncbi:hypothetical protein AS034_14480 [[Bacillus] enclensis]|nr:hypothetical protein AS034_14480 [[Bacillus] enclensis]